MARRLIEIILPPRHQATLRHGNTTPSSGPTGALYKWTLRRLGFRTTITEFLRDWQRAEPLVWLLAVGIAGAFLGHRGDPGNFLWLGTGVMIGLLTAHLFWGAR